MSNLDLWNAVSKTNPANTKQVNQRGGFTAVNAHSQILAATEQFGPVGIGWGYVAGQPYFHDNLMFMPVTIWHSDRSNTFGPWHGCEEWRDKNGRVDSDVSKKAMTDAITKGLSHLGFNADVFLGKFDDQKYINALRDEFSTKPATIDAGQISDIHGMIEGYGLNLGKILQHYKIKSFTEIPADEFTNVTAQINRWNDAAIKKREAAKEQV